MIITKTPFRVSFAGGGTDLKEFYEREEGAVLSTTINKYMYIAIHKFFENKIVLKYSQTEHVDNVDQIQHKLIKHCFLKTNTNKFVEITSFADIPASGTGLGSSSAFTVGLLKALYTFNNRNRDNIILAKEAHEIEVEELEEPGGKQDQYACAVGGMNVIRFCPDGSVFVEPLTIPKSTKRELDQNLLMFYTGISRKSSLIHLEQRKEVSKIEKFNNLRQMRELVYELKDSLREKDLSKFGEILDKGWHLKKGLTSITSNNILDDYYDKAIRLGAAGGKILGAGGGGFYLFYCDPEKQQNLRENLGLREVKFEFEPQGSRIIYLEDSDEF
jgi:D-glycero-alpha-D-manno-heptose-7-phosphate kinase